MRLLLFCLFISFCSEAFASGKPAAKSFESCSCDKNMYLHNTDEFQSIFKLQEANEGACVGCDTGVSQRSHSIVYSLFQPKSSAAPKDFSGTPLDKSCLLPAMHASSKRGSKRGGYYACSSKRRRVNAIKVTKADHKNKCVSRRVKYIYPARPCIDEAYVSVVQNVLSDTSDCLGVPAGATLPLFIHESRLMLNNRSSTGAVCLGQLTGPAIESVYNVNLKKGSEFYKRLKNSPSCAQVRKGLAVSFKSLDKLPTKSRNTTRRCELANNPYVCALYSKLFFKNNYEHVLKLLKSKKRKKFYNMIEDPEGVAHFVATWSHNAGASLYSTYLKYYMSYMAKAHYSKYRGKKMSFKAFASSFRNYMKRGIKDNPDNLFKTYSDLKRRRQKEILNFMPKIYKDAKIYLSAPSCQQIPLLRKMSRK